MWTVAAGRSRPAQTSCVRRRHRRRRRRSWRLCRESSCCSAEASQSRAQPLHHVSTKHPLSRLTTQCARFFATRDALILQTRHMGYGRGGNTHHASQHSPCCGVFPTFRACPSTSGSSPHPNIRPKHDAESAGGVARDKQQKASVHKNGHVQMRSALRCHEASTGVHSFSS